MNKFIEVLFVFIFFCTLGWISEVIFRRFVSAKKWVNPGFLNGPCLPIYGFGASLMYLIIYAFSFLKEDFNNAILYHIVVVILLGVIMTLIEYIGGIIFIKKMHIRLWDYSDRWGNIDGVICPLFSLIWLVVGAIFYFFLYDYIVIAATYLTSKSIYILLIGVCYGIFFVDLGMSFNVATKIKEFADQNEIIIKYENFKDIVRNNLKEAKQKWNYLFNFKGLASVKDKIDETIKKLKEEKKIEFKKKKRK